MADWSALGNMVSGLMPLVSRPGSGAANYGANANAAFQEQQVQEAIKREQQKQEKAKKGKMFGSIGATLGTLGGVALAPLTGGASLLVPAALGAAGGAIGGAAGELAGGGRVAVNDVLKYGAQGAAGGFAGGMGAGVGAGGPMEAGMGAGGNLLETGAAGIGKSAFAPTSKALVKSTLGNMFGDQMRNIPLGGMDGGGYQAPSGGIANRQGGYGNSYIPSRGALKMDANTGEYYYTPWGM